MSYWSLFVTRFAIGIVWHLVILSIYYSTFYNVKTEGLKINDNFVIGYPSLPIIPVVL